MTFNAMLLIFRKYTATVLEPLSLIFPFFFLGLLSKELIACKLDITANNAQELAGVALLMMLLNLNLIRETDYRSILSKFCQKSTLDIIRNPSDLTINQITSPTSEVEKIFIKLPESIFSHLIMR